MAAADAARSGGRRRCGPGPARRAATGSSSAVCSWPPRLCAVVLPDAGGRSPRSDPGAACAATGPWGPLLAWVGLAGAGRLASLSSTRCGRTCPGPEGLTGPAATAVVAVAVRRCSWSRWPGPCSPSASRRRPRSATDHEVWAAVSAWSESAPPGRVLVLPATDGRLDGAVAEALGIGRGSAATPCRCRRHAATGALDDCSGGWAADTGDRTPPHALQRLGIAYVLLRNDVSASVDRERPLVWSGMPLPRRVLRGWRCSDRPSWRAGRPGAPPWRTSESGRPRGASRSGRCRGRGRVGLRRRAADRGRRRRGGQRPRGVPGMAGSRPVRIVPPGSDGIDVVV